MLCSEEQLRPADGAGPIAGLAHGGQVEALLLVGKEAGPFPRVGMGEGIAGVDQQRFGGVFPNLAKHRAAAGHSARLVGFAAAVLEVPVGVPGEHQREA